jgi:AcrR family transcriptional regulator
VGAGSFPCTDPASLRARGALDVVTDRQVPGVDLRPPQQARSRAVLQKVLGAAEDVLALDGLDGFTIAAVAERAGVSVGGLYRRFTGKEQLLAAVKDRLLTRLETRLSEALASARLATVRMSTPAAMSSVAE